MSKLAIFLTVYESEAELMETYLEQRCQDSPDVKGLPSGKFLVSVSKRDQHLLEEAYDYAQNELESRE